jgi:AbrB family looped-hinge helix DNA binding protein
VKAIVSTKGQVVIPHDIRKLLGIHPGDEVTIKSSHREIFLEKVVKPAAKPRLKLAKGRMPILKMPRQAGPLTPMMVKEIAQL